VALRFVGLELVASREHIQGLTNWAIPLRVSSTTILFSILAPIVPTIVPNIFFYMIYLRRISIWEIKKQNNEMTRKKVKGIPLLFFSLHSRLFFIFFSYGISCLFMLFLFQLSCLSLFFFNFYVGLSPSLFLP